MLIFEIIFELIFNSAIKTFESPKTSIGSTIFATIILTIIYGAVVALCVWGILSDIHLALKFLIGMLAGLFIFLLIRLYYKLIKYMGK